ncbi:MAG: choice-of-anchor Q domain-containing protein [Acidimicrobiales bacterium]|jgi:hypothetical protein
MKRRIARLFIAVVCSVSGLATVSVAGATPSSPDVITVSTTADVVNGVTSSPSALAANPGPDGISLREAILASDHSKGLIAITFAKSLVGKTINLKSDLPPLTHVDTKIIGLTTDSGLPAVTLDGAQDTTPCCSGLLEVFASDITISNLQFVNILHDNVAVAVRAGVPGGEQAIHNVLIDSNVFNNADQFGVAIGIGTYFPGYILGGSRNYSGAVSASLNDVSVTNNVVEGFTDDGINVGLYGTDCSMANLLIQDNQFVNNTGPANPALEIGSAYSHNSIVGTNITNNTFTGNPLALFLAGGEAGVNQGNGSPIPATDNTLSNTSVSQNFIEGSQSSIQIVGGVGPSLANENSVVNTEFSNDVIADSTSAETTSIYIFGGEDNATNNQVNGVSFVNDTIAFNAGGGLWADAGGLGNQILSPTIENTIFWMNNFDFGGTNAALFESSLNASLIGVNPLFVSQQNLNLQAGSPAIGAGSVTGAPTVDIDDGLRNGAPDIGAYQFAAASRPQLDVNIDELGGTGVVHSIPAGISCKSTCYDSFGAGSSVTLTATPAVGSRFAGWAGSCKGTGDCTLTLATASTVSATFSKALPPSKKIPTSRRT